MSYYSVIGLGFGDEVKGMTTDYLCSQSKNPIVVRFSGGQQAGHTVNYNGLRHVFSNFGSGTLRGTPTFWSKYCTMDPEGILREYKLLKEKGVNPVLIIDPEAMVTTPFDKAFDKDSDCLREDGTCGVGVGVTKQREKDHYHLRFKDLFNPTVLNCKLQVMSDYYDVVDYAKMMKFISDCQEVTCLCIMKEISCIDKYDDVIFESSQGLLLDQDIGFFPYVTRSSVGMGMVNKICKGMVKTYAVTRAYSTRHGNGPFVKEENSLIKLNPDETNVTNKFQGRFRRGWLDVHLLDYALREGIFKHINLDVTLVVSCLDHVESVWRFDKANEIYKFDSEVKFIEALSTVAGISKIIKTRSPRTEDIKI